MTPFSTFVAAPAASVPYGQFDDSKGFCQNQATLVARTKEDLERGVFNRFIASQPGFAGARWNYGTDGDRPDFTWQRGAIGVELGRSKGLMGGSPRSFPLAIAAAEFLRQQRRHTVVERIGPSLTIHGPATAAELAPALSAPTAPLGGAAGDPLGGGNN